MSEIEVFNFEDAAEIRVVRRDDEPWFVAADVCKILGIGTSNLSKVLDPDEKGSYTVRTPGGDQRVSVVNEPGLYSLILKSRKPEAKRFKRWVTHEVLPTIRKTGGYATPGTDLHRMLADSPLDALRAVAETATKLAEENLALKQRIEEDAPKVLVAEEFFDSEGLMGIREASRSFSIPERRFTAMLRDWDWIEKYGTAAKASVWKSGLMENKVVLINGGRHQRLQGKFTRRGIERVATKLREAID